jgi:hypothetical protein
VEKSSAWGGPASRIIPKPTHSPIFDIALHNNVYMYILFQDQQYDVISTVSAILHLGNIVFTEGSGTEQSAPQNKDGKKPFISIRTLTSLDIS